MVQPVGREAYREQLFGLLPTGRAWPRGPGTVLYKLLDASAERFADIDRRAVGLLDELLVSRTFDLLPEWEADLGLPDSCSVLGSSVQVRRAAALHKQVSKPDMSPEAYREIARSFGVEIAIDELNQARADAIAGLDTTNGKWRFVWWIAIPLSSDVQYFTTESDVETPLSTVERNTELECRLQKASPAHTRLYVGYAADLNYWRLAALPGAFAVRFTASANHQDLFEVTPAEGTELEHAPPGMYSDDAIYWIERVRSTENGVQAVDDAGVNYRKAAVSLHRGASTVRQDAFLGGLAAGWSWVLINVSTEEWIMWPGAPSGDVGNGFVNYTIVPTFIADTAGRASSDVDAIAQSFSDGETATAAQTFQNALPESEIIVALIPNNTFRASFQEA